MRVITNLKTQIRKISVAPLFTRSLFILSFIDMIISCFCTQSIYLLEIEKKVGRISVTEKLSLLYLRAAQFHFFTISQNNKRFVIKA